MFLLKMIAFCKSSTCPTSQDLLDYQHSQISGDFSRMIRRHIASCDFCGAEFDLYEHYPQGDESISISEIPGPLFELAESLLRNGHKDSSLLNKLLIEDKGLTLTGA